MLLLESKRVDPARIIRPRIEPTEEELPECRSRSSLRIELRMRLPEYSRSKRLRELILRS